MAKAEYNYVGKTYAIHDAWEKVCGAPVYTEDITLPRMCHARLLFSPLPHAAVKRINTAVAEALPGVVGVFTHLNTPRKMYNSAANHVGQSMVCDERLFADTVRFVGDRVAAVVAETPEIAQAALELIEVDYEPLKPHANLREAAADTTDPIHPGGNLLHEKTLATGDSAAAFQSSREVDVSEVYVPRLHHAAMEPHCCLARYDEQGQLCIWSPCQGAFGVRNAVADFLEMSYSDVRVVKMPMGGSFGGKQQVLLEVFTAWMAKALRRAVMVRYNRAQSMLSTSAGTAMLFTLSTALAEDARIKGMEISALADAGAYATNSVGLPIAAGKKAFRTYSIPNMTYRSTAIYTNTTPAGGLRGWGGPIIATALEIHMDNVARRRGLCPVQFRLRHVVAPYAVDPNTGVSLGNARLRECVEQGAAAFGWEEKKAACANQAPGRYRRGIGLACGGHHSGYYGDAMDHANIHLKLNEDGSFLMNTGVHEQGCGTLVSLAVIAAEVLDVPPERIRVLEADTHRSPHDIGTYASRVTYVSGKCALLAAQSIRDSIVSQAAAMLGTPASMLSCKGGAVVAQADGRRVSFAEVATHAAVRQDLEIAVLQRHSNTSKPGAYGCHFAEVEVDCCTGLVRVVDYLAAQDVGRCINTGMVEDQIRGAVQMGIGYALTEELEFDEKGMPRTVNFDKYTLLNMPDMPEVRTLVLECGGDDGPFEAKSVGEAALCPAPGAVANAVNNALGTYLGRLPLNPKRIIKALEERREKP